MNKTATSLHIYSRLLPPDTVTKALGQAASRSYKKGTFASPRNPRSLVRDESVWIVEFAENLSSTEAFSEVLSWLAGKSPQLDGFLHDCSTVLNYSVWLEDADSAGQCGCMEITGDLLEKLAENRIGITFRVYPLVL